MTRVLWGCVLVLGFGWGLGATSNAQQPAETVIPVKPASDSTVAAESKTAPAEERSRSTRESRAQSKDVIAEFKSSADPEAADGRVPSQAKRLTFNFHLAPWSIVLKRFAQEADLTLDMIESDTPPGSFSYLDGKKYTVAEALDLLNGYLLKRGYLLIRRDKFLVVWNIDNPIPPNLIPLVSLNDLEKHGLNEYMSVLVPLGDSIDAKSASEEISDLLGPQGKARAMANSNHLKVSDIGTNLREIVEFLSNVKAKNEPKSMTFKSFKLVYISASEAERELRELFGLAAKASQTKAAAEAATAATARTPNNSDQRNDSRGGGGRNRGGWPGGGGGGWGGGFPGGGGGFPGAGGGGDSGGDPAAAMAAMFAGRGGRGGGGAPEAGQPAAGSSTYKISMSADNRGNNLLVTATVEEMRLVEKAIESIDVKKEPSDRDGIPRGKNDPRLVVYALETADPDVVMEVLNAMVPGLVIYEDTKTHRLNIYATPSEHAQVREIIKELDTGAGELIAVVPLNRLTAKAAAGSLKSLFSTSTKVDPPNIEADEIGRRLLIRGTPDQISQIKKLLTDMGEFGRPAASEPRRSGPIRTLIARGRSASEIMDLVDDLPDGVKGFIRVAPSTASAAPTFRVWDFDEGRDNSSPGGPAAGDSSRSTASQSGLPRDTQMNTNGLRRDVRRPAGVSPEEIRRVLFGSATGAERPAAPPPEREQPRKPAATNSPDKSEGAGDVDDLSRQLDDALRQKDELPPEDVDEPGDHLLDEIETGESSNGGSSREASSNESQDRQTEDAAVPRSNSVGNRGPKVVMKVVGDRIRLYSDDPSELDRAEALIEQLLSEAPSEPEWIICRLHTADATETATMLNYLFPEGTAVRTTPTTTAGGGPFGMFASRTPATEPASLGGSLSNAGTLKVIPDVASNSLYISGPEDVLPKVKQWLRVLDSSDSKKLPKPIEVKYADVQDIADAVSGLFREEMGTAQQQQQGRNRGGGGGGGFGGGFNPFAMMMGGNQQQQQRIQLSVFPDVRTNNLMVYASDKLYRQVESVVRSLDESAHLARRTVQVVTLKNVNSAIVTQTLSALTHKVQTSSAAGNHSAGNRNGTNAAADGGITSQTDTANQRGQAAGGMNPFGGGQRGGGQGFGGQGQGQGGQGFGGRGGSGRGGGGRQGGN